MTRPCRIYDNIAWYDAVFHKFSTINNEEYAIVETSDGQVQKVHLYYFKFKDDLEIKKEFYCLKDLIKDLEKCVEERGNISIVSNGDHSNKSEKSKNMLLKGALWNVNCFIEPIFKDLLGIED